MDNDPGMPLPFPLPRVSAGFAALTPAAREAGRALADAAAAALAAALATKAHLGASPLPAAPGAARGMAVVAIPLDGIATAAQLEVEVAFVARVLQRMASGAAPIPAALTETHAERALLDLAALVAVDAARSVAPLERLHPRVALAGERDPEALVVALEMTLGEERGRGRLLVPPAAVRALASPGTPDLTRPIADVALEASFREGTISLSNEDLGALEPGDVLLADEGAPVCSAVLPGGLALSGHTDAGFFHIEVIRMTETQAAYPLTLAVEIGRIVLTLGDLSRLEPGSTLPLDLRRDGAVVLRAGERAIARGNLVEVGGALGMRIAELGERP